MTVAIGVLCTDGVVIGTDSSATFAAGPTFNTIEQPAKKVFVLGDDLIFAGTGQVGLGQRFHSVISKIKGAFKNSSDIDVGKAISAATMKDFSETQAPRQFGALVGFACATGLHLVELSPSDLQPEKKTAEMWFCAMGSGQPIADPFLAFIKRSFFKGTSPKLSEGVFVVYWALMQAIELNTGGIQGPPQIAVLHKNESGKPRSRILTQENLDEHDSNVQAAEEHLRAFRENLTGRGSAVPNPPPQPPQLQPPPQLPRNG